MGSQRWVLPYIDMKSNHCVFIEVPKLPQFTCQVDTVTESSYTSSVALLVHPSGPYTP